jgi:GNAT superfamily N-acetyltransferase
MIELRPAESDADLESWRRVRAAVLPTERVATVAEMRRSARPEQLLLLAELDGEIAGSGIAGRSDTGGRGFVAPRVLPDRRRLGVGTALLRELAAHLHRSGFSECSAGVDDEGSGVFAGRFGFREVDRQVEQVRAVAGEPMAEPPAGVEIVSIAERPELWRAAYDPLAKQAFADMALDAPVEASLEQWEREWITWPEGTFVALAAGEVVGCAGLLRDDDQPERAENALTAVRRDWRGRGVAAALKRTTLAFADANGIREVYTWTQRGNDDMRRLNEHLGYVERAWSITLRASLDDVLERTARKAS